MPLWLVICALGLTQIIGWGTTYYALGALSTDIAASMGWSKTFIFGAFSASILLSGLVSRRAGRFVDLKGGRRAMMIGSVIAALGCAVIGIPHPVTYVIGWLILGPAMRLATYDAAFASLAQIAPAQARRAISYLSLFGGLASTVFWPLSHLLSENIGWSHTLLVYAALHILICLPLHALVLRAAKGEVAAPSTEENAEGLLAPQDRFRAMALFAAALALNGVVFAAISAHAVPLFQGLGFAGASAVTMAALIGPAQVASRLGEIMMGRKLKAMHVGLLAFGLLPIAFLVFAAGGFGLTAALAFAVVYGASNGLVTIAKGAVPLALFGRKGYGEMLGLLTAPALYLNAGAPLGFAVLLEALGPHGALMVAGAVALVSGAAMAVLARLHPH